MDMGSVASTALKIGGSLISAGGQRSAGNAAYATAQDTAKQTIVSGDFAAKQLRQQGNAAAASSQRSAEDVGQRGDYVMSRALAVAAASGAGASSPGVINILAKLAGEKAYRQSLEIYAGQDKQQNLNTQADTAIYNAKVGANAVLRQGANIQQAANINANTSLLKGATSLFDKYGGGGPSSNTNDDYGMTSFDTNTANYFDPVYE